MATSTATATFTGGEDSVAVTWALTSVTPTTSTGVCTSDAPLGVVSVDLTSITSSGATVVPSERFTGTVEIIAMD